MKKLIITLSSVSIIALFAVVFSGFLNKNNQENYTETKSQIIQTQEHIKIRNRSASIHHSLEDYSLKETDIYISNEVKADFLFTSVGLSWEETTSENTEVFAEMRFKVNEKWTEWIELEIEEDPFVYDKNINWAVGSTNPATKVQYKFIMYGDKENSPEIFNPEINFIRAGNFENQNNTVSVNNFIKPEFASSSDFQTAMSKLANSGQIGRYFIRSQWGANESYRYLENNDKPAELIKLDDEFYEKYADELRYSRIVEFDEDGNKYKWPLKYPEKVSKFIVHHTASTRNLDNSMQAVRDIYHYHAVSRGWGDVGYNYFIDTEGNVYEGRYGGEGVIGAHSGPGNHGSIGVVLLGHYQEEEVPEEAIASLAYLIHQKSKIHNINTEGFSSFRGKNSPNIIGHRDIMNTQCPGDILYSKLPIIRVLANQAFNQKEKFVKEYDFQDLSELYYIELKPEERRNITVRLENIGNKNWGSNTKLIIEQNAEFKNVLSFPDEKGAIIEMDSPRIINSGSVATWTFTLEAGSRGGTVYPNMTLLVDGNRKLNEYIKLPLHVQQPYYNYEIVSSNFPPNQMQSGEEFEGWVRLKNLGNTTWQRSGDNEIFLRNSKFEARLQEASVAPGQRGIFQFTYKATSSTGQKTEILTPTLDDGNFGNKETISFNTLIYRSKFDGDFLSKTNITEWGKGRTYNVSFSLKNVGLSEWRRQDLQLIARKNPHLEISGLNMSPSTVKIGENASFNFTVKVNENSSLGDFIFFARPEFKGNSVMAPIDFYYKISKDVPVSETPAPQDPEENSDIRIKLSFNAENAGNPKITSSGDYEVYTGNNLIATMSSSEITEVSKSGNLYRVDADGEIFTSSSPVRFLPKNNSIMKVSNYEARPAWNPSLNDNEFRGILEVRDDDGDLVVINELDLENYLKGLGEVPNSEPLDKIKTIMVAARTYAYYYMTLDEKFPGKPYHLDDDPNVSQKYIGYGFEKRAPNITKSVNETAGEMVVYNNKIVKTPYFNQSDGEKTKSAFEVWGWTTTPYLISVDDSYCEENVFLGHGVGVSGCGATAMAKIGKDYKEILTHYYTGVDIIKIY